MAKVERCFWNKVFICFASQKVARVFVVFSWRSWFAFGAARLVLSRLSLRRKLRRLSRQRVSSDV